MPPNILLQFMHILERPQASEDVQREVLRNGRKNVYAAVCLCDSCTHILIPRKTICIYFAHQRYILKDV